MYFWIKAIKNNRLTLLFSKVLLFIFLSFYIVWELNQHNFNQLWNFKRYRFIYLIGAIGLIYVNQWCEWKKWQIAAKRLTSENRIIRKSFFSGITAAFVTPNGWGSFLGRMMYFKRKDRVFIILSAFLGNASQVLVTLIFGAISCWWSNRLPLFATISATIVACIICFGFFFGERLMKKKKTRFNWLRHFQLVQERLSALRLPLALWSALRYCVFTAQYVLLFLALGYSDILFFIPRIGLIFLLTSFVPSLWSGKIIIRETAAIFVFSVTVISIPDVVLVSLMIWILNHLIPLFVSMVIWLFGFKHNKYAVN